MEKTKKILEKAEETVNDKKKLTSLLSSTAKKVKGLASNSSDWTEMKTKINTMVKMVQSHISGEYKAFPTSSILLVVFGLLYFTIPTDAIPDFIPALGFTDDASVLFLIYKKLNKDIEKFLDWKESSAQK